MCWSELKGIVMFVLELVTSTNHTYLVLYKQHESLRRGKNKSTRQIGSARLKSFIWRKNIHYLYVSAPK